MNKHWEFIAQCLRAELADYGGLLHLFEAQERSRSNRDGEAVLKFATEIESQERSLADSRSRREQAVATFAKQNSRPITSSLRAMLPLIESDARPLLQALIGETDLLLRRVRRASRRHHALFSPPHRDSAKNAAGPAFGRGDEDAFSGSARRRDGPTSAHTNVGRR